MSLIAPIVFIDNELRTVISLMKVFTRMISNKRIFQQKWFQRYKNHALIQFKTMEQQVSYLKNIIKHLNRCDYNFDTELENLPIYELDFDNYIKFNPIGGIEITKSLKEHQERTGATDYLFTMFRSPVDYVIKGECDDVYSITTFPKRLDESAIPTNSNLFDDNIHNVIEYLLDFCPKDDHDYAPSDVVKNSDRILNILSLKPCGHCKKVSSMHKCSECFIIYYCNNECQRKDWQGHKKVCKYLRECKRLLWLFLDKSQQEKS